MYRQNTDNPKKATKSPAQKWTVFKKRLDVAEVLESDLFFGVRLPTKTISPVLEADAPISGGSYIYYFFKDICLTSSTKGPGIWIQP